MHAAASLAAPAGPCRGYSAEDVRPTPGGPQKHIKIEFTRCPGRCEAHPSLSLLFPRDTRMSHPLTTFGATSVADAFTTGDLGKEKDSIHHLSSSALRQGHLSPREKQEKKVVVKIIEKLTSIVFL